MRIYSTLTRTKQELSPLTPGEVRMYVCGITPYDLSHVGHARSAIVFDVVRRYLAFRGYRVRLVKNFTDVDDKIIRRARDEGVSSTDVSERYIAEYEKDMADLGVLPADVEPRATEHIGPMIELIERLLAAGVAYVVDGDVYFEVRRFPAYGRLSGRNLDELLAGARVEVDERKRDPLDFALWKAAKPGEPWWESPWGPGRPGWHIECSAMSLRYLGESFDIHGGGEDLVFPHHENEIAQSEACTGKPFAAIWMHNAFVNLAAEKMSKSLGNTLTIRDLLRRHDPEALRLWLVGTHYRNPVEFSEDRIRESARSLDRLRSLVTEADRLAPPPSGSRLGMSGQEPGDAHSTIADALSLLAPGGGDLASRVTPCVDRFREAMDDDFNTPAALAALFDLSRELYRYRDAAAGRADEMGAFGRGVDLLVRLGQRGLGLLVSPGSRAGALDELAPEIERLVALREEARRRRDWKEADAVRDRLAGLGVAVEDTPSGPRWKWKGA
jgi:cysteinyl-tRNA synthetase